MNADLPQPQARGDILQELREMAMKGTTVAQLVRLIREKAGYKDGVVLPVLWYFAKAFCLPLPAILPLREWFIDHNDEEIDALLIPQIEASRPEWSRMGDVY